MTKTEQSVRRWSGPVTLIAAAISLTAIAGNAAASTYSALQFTTVNSGTFTLRGVNGTSFAPANYVVATTGPVTNLNPPGSTPTTTNLSPYGSGYWVAYHWDWVRPRPGGLPPLVFDDDVFGFDWQFGNTGFDVLIEFNVTFGQAVQLVGGGSAWLQNQSTLTAAGQALNQNDILAAGTYALQWEWVNPSAGNNTGTNFSLNFRLASPSPIPGGTGLAALAIGAVGLRGRRRSRN